MHKRILIGLLLCFIYLVSRIRFIFTFPVFFDEAIYIHWAQAVKQDWTWRFVSLIDGKQPLFVWLTSIGLRVITDPIIAGRTISVIAGFISLLALSFLTERLFGKRVAVVAAIVYILTPFYLIYDGLAIMDSLLLCLSILSSFFIVKLARNQTIASAICLGLFWGLGLLTKSGAQFFLLLIPAGSLLIHQLQKKVVFRYLVFSTIALILAKLIESILRLSIYYPIINQKNHEFVRSFSEVVSHPFSGFGSNAFLIGGWIVEYLGVSTVVMAVLACIFFRHNTRKLLFLVSLSIFPIMVMMVFGKQLYPRHFLFMTWPIVVLAAYSIDTVLSRLPNSSIRMAFLVLLLFLFSQIVITDYFLLTNPWKAALPEIERWQFLEGEPSGFGIEKVYTFFDTKKQNPLLILTDKPVGILADGISLHYFNNKNVRVIGTDGIDKDRIRQALRNRQSDDVYLVFSWQDVPTDIKATKEMEIERPGKNNKNWRIYRLVKKRNQ